MTTPTTVNARFQLRADTAANWASVNPTLLTNELGLETDTKRLKVGNGSTAWNSLGYFPSIVSGGTVLGNLEIGTTGTLTFEGSTADGFETTLAVTDPTADRTITLPDQSGTVVVSGNASITNADIAANAEIAVSKLANGTANQVIVTDGTNVSWSDNLTLAGDLTVNGTTTTINTETLTVKDKNIELAVVDTPTDVTADGGGITLKGTTDKTINWVDATDAWTSSEHVDLASGKSYRINGTEVLSSTTLGSGVTGSSLTSVGTIATGVWQGSAIDATYLDSTIVTTGDTGTVTSTMIADGTIVDGDINASAAIAGTKISPNFGSQNVTTTGTSTAASFIPTSSTVPTNGVYLPAANSVALSTNGAQRISIGSDGDINIDSGGVFYDASTNRLGIGTTNPNRLLEIAGSGGANNVEFRLNATDGGARQITFTGSGSGTQIIKSTGATDNSLVILQGANERARIDSSGRLLVGTSTDSGGALLQINGNRIRIATAKTPASATDTGVAGEVCWDSGYIYVCTATNTWKRAALATW